MRVSPRDPGSMSLRFFVFGSDARFFALEQTANIFAMHEKDQQGQKSSKRRIALLSEQIEIKRRQRDGDQSGERRDAPDQRRQQPCPRYGKPGGPVKRHGYT